MFSATKSVGPYTLPNSRKKFVQELESAASMVSKSGKLKQSKLCLNKSWQKLTKTKDANDEGNKQKIETAKIELFKLPTPEVKKTVVEINSNQKHLNDATCVRHAASLDELKPSDNNKDVTNPMEKMGRNLQVIVGKVDFCIKMHQKHAAINAIWDIYGKLLKITAGKQQQEFILLLRSDDGGPVLQAVYYDFTNVLTKYKIGCCTRIVGRFIGQNRLQTFKLQQLPDNTIVDNFTRIHNVIGFALVQNEMKIS